MGVQRLVAAASHSFTHHTMSFLTGAISRAAKASVAVRQPLLASSRAVGGARLYSSGHEEESYEAFTERYAKFFESVEDTLSSSGASTTASPTTSYPEPPSSRPP